MHHILDSEAGNKI